MISYSLFNLEACASYFIRKRTSVQSSQNNNLKITNNILKIKISEKIVLTVYGVYFKCAISQSETYIIMVYYSHRERIFCVA
jgi:hypothetical protein